MTTPYMRATIILGLLICLIALAPSVQAQPVSVQLYDGNALTVIADVTVTGTATLIAAANQKRTALNCTNTSSSVNVRWGGSDVAATTGQRLGFGLAITIRNIGAIYMISEGASVTVSCTEEKKP